LEHARSVANSSENDLFAFGEFDGKPLGDEAAAIGEKLVSGFNIFDVLHKDWIQAIIKLRFREQ
jgi:hypothetical protein